MLFSFLLGALRSPTRYMQPKIFLVKRGKLTAEGASGLYEPPSLTLQEAWLLDQSEKGGAFDKLFEVCYGVAPVFLVVEVEPEPSPAFSVEYVESAAFRVTGDYQEQQHRRRKLYPAGNFWMIGLVQ